MCVVCVPCLAGIAAAPIVDAGGGGILVSLTDRGRTDGRTAFPASEEATYRGIQCMRESFVEVAFQRKGGLNLVTTAKRRRTALTSFSLSPQENINGGRGEERGAFFS